MRDRNRAGQFLTRALAFAVALILTVCPEPGLAAVRSELSGTMVPESPEEARSIVHIDDRNGYEFPFMMSAYFFQGKQQYDSPGLGYSLTYASMPRTYVSVYLYDSGFDDIADGCQGSRVRVEMDNAISGIVQSGKQAGVEHEFKQPPMVIPGFVQSYSTYVQQGTEVNSYVMIRGHQGKFLKVRITGASKGMTGRLPSFFMALSAVVGLDKDIECTEAAPESSPDAFSEPGLS